MVCRTEPHQRRRPRRGKTLFLGQISSGSVLHVERLIPWGFTRSSPLRDPVTCENFGAQPPDVRRLFLAALMATRFEPPERQVGQVARRRAEPEDDMTRSVKNRTEVLAGLVERVTAVGGSGENSDGRSNGTTVDSAIVAFPFSLRITALQHRPDMPPASGHHQLSGKTKWWIKSRR